MNRDSSELDKAAPAKSAATSKGKLAFQFMIAAMSVVSWLACTSGNVSVRQIEIKSYYVGLGVPQRSAAIVIRNERGTYRLGQEQVDPALVKSLVAALREPPLNKPDMLNLGITPVWLKMHIQSAEEKYAAQFIDAAPNQMELFRTSFADPQFIEKVVPGLFEGYVFDDYPSATLKVTFENGFILSAHTHSAHLLLLPWEVTSRGTGLATYNAGISRSLAALLPKDATNRERFNGDDMDVRLAHAVWQCLKPEREILDVQNNSGDALPLLQTKYKVKTAEINSDYYHPEYGEGRLGDNRQETNLHATLQKSTFPSDLAVALVLRWRAGKVEGVREFLQAGDKYEALALSVPWLITYTRLRTVFPSWDDICDILIPLSLTRMYEKGSPRALIRTRISYVHDASMGDKALNVFAADMHAIGKDKLAEQVRSEQKSVVLLMTSGDFGQSYWIVLPDRRTVLWRSAGPPDLPDWKSSDFPAHECSEYQGVGITCVGAVVSPHGELVK